MLTTPDTPLSVFVHLAFAFDVGFEIDLERARPLVAGEEALLARRRRTPESIRYRPAPVRVGIDASGVTLPGISPAGPVRSVLSLFDFGAVSLAITVPVHTTAQGLLDLAAALAEPAALTAAARLVLLPWLDRLRPCVSGFEFSDLSEEYIVFQLGEVAAGWLESNADYVARLVRLESGRLSQNEIVEATRLNLSYAPNDLLVLDWAAAFLADHDCDETLQVIEFANVQLLEFRQIDDRLDDRLEAAYRLIVPQERRLPRPWNRYWRGHNAAVRQVRELEIEATSLFERTDNALKLIGDQYLSRVFGMTSERFHLDEWQQSIRRKLDTVGDVYDLLVQQAGSLRLEALELIVILLIALEIALALLRH